MSYSESLDVLLLLITTDLAFFFFFFFNDTATTEIYTLSLHDALPICFDEATTPSSVQFDVPEVMPNVWLPDVPYHFGDRKSTRLNSSHLVISYAVFCLKKKKKKIYDQLRDLIGTRHPCVESKLQL